MTKLRIFLQGFESESETENPVTNQVSTVLLTAKTDPINLRLHDTNSDRSVIRVNYSMVALIKTLFVN